MPSRSRTAARQTAAHGDDSDVDSVTHPSTREVAKMATLDALVIRNEEGVTKRVVRPSDWYVSMGYLLTLISRSIIASLLFTEA